MPFDPVLPLDGIGSESLCCKGDIELIHRAVPPVTS